jgi:hypothetical protein
MESEYRRRLGEAARVEWTLTAFPNFDNEEQIRVRNEACLLFPIGGTKSCWNWKIGAKHEYQLNNAVQLASPSDFQGYFSIMYSK